MVLSPAPQLYFDHVQSALPDEYAGRLGVESLHDVYGFQAIPGVLDAGSGETCAGRAGRCWDWTRGNRAAFAQWMTPRFGPYLPSLAFAIVFVVFWWLVVWAMDRRGIHLKL
ncbi:hypothetical protein RLIN73S_04375 [Rhodanobacter lindaniclasticus]